MDNHITPNLFFKSFFFSEYPLFQQKRTFESNEEIETLIYDNQHVGENSECHKIEILSPFVEKNKNMAYQCMNAFIKTYEVCY